MKPLYRAVEDKDGTYSILDVPIFAEVPEGTKNAPGNIGRKWMEQAIAAAARLEKDNGYLPPLNYGHHGKDEVRKIGHFRLRGAKAVQFEDKEQVVLTADFVKLPKEEFDRFMRGDYPYRSVEISDWSDPRINHLSVLAHQEPHFKLPMTNGDTIKLSEMKEAQLSAFEGKRAFILFHEEYEMPNPATKPEKKGKQRIDGVRAFLAAFEAGEIDADGNPVAKGAEGDEPTEAELAAFAREFLDAPADKRAAMLAALDEEEEEGSDDDPTPAELDGRTAAKLAAAEDKAEEALQRVATFEAGQKSEKDSAARLARAEADLAGYNVGAKGKAVLFAAAQKDDAEVARVVDALKESCPKEPVTFDEAGFKAEPAFQGLNIGPDEMEDAARFSAMYDETAKRNPRLLGGMSKKDYVQSQFESRKAQNDFAANAS